MLIIPIESYSEFVCQTGKIAKKWSKQGINVQIWYRGQINANWHLIPKLYREQFKHIIPRQYEAIVEWIAQAQSFQDTPKEYESRWDWYVEMQHFGFPTRLLDWTRRPLTALWFAVYELSNLDAVVWAISPEKMNNVFNDLSKIPSPGVAGYWTKDKLIRTYIPGEWSSDLHPLPLAIFCRYRNRRIAAQSGTFTLHGAEKLGIDELIENKSVDEIVKFVIKKDKINNIQKELLDRWIKETDVFPELGWLAVELIRIIGEREKK